jgi:hypothetical protein
VTIPLTAELNRIEAAEGLSRKALSIAGEQEVKLWEPASRRGTVCPLPPLRRAARWSRPSARRPATSNFRFVAAAGRRWMAVLDEIERRDLCSNVASVGGR